MIALTIVYGPDNGFAPEKFKNLDAYLKRVRKYLKDPTFIPLDADGVTVIGDAARTLFVRLHGDATEYDRLSREVLCRVRDGEFDGAYGFTTVLALKWMQERGISIRRKDISSVGRDLPYMFGSKEAISILNKHNKKVVLFSSMYRPALDQICRVLNVEGRAIELEFDGRGKLLRVNLDDYILRRLRYVGGSFKLREIEEFRMKNEFSMQETCPIGDSWSDLQTLLFFAEKGGSIAFNPKAINLNTQPRREEMCPSDVAKINVYSMNMLAVVPLVVRNPSRELQNLYTEAPSLFLPELLVINANNKTEKVLDFERKTARRVNDCIHERLKLDYGGIY